MTMRELKRLIAQGEGVQIECKLSHEKLATSMWETYSAFANTHGGTILLGVRQHGCEFEIAGVTDPDRQIQEIFNIANNRTKCNINLLRDNDVERIVCGSETIIAVRVPEAPRGDKPIYLNGNPYGGTYRRRNEGDYKCSTREVDRMIAEKTDSYDGRIFNKYTLDDLDEETFRAYRQIFTNRNPLHPYTELDNAGFLEAIGGFDTDRETGAKGLTLAGLLMFGKLRHILRLVPNYMVDYREYGATRKITDRWIDRLITDDTWPGNLFAYCQRVTRKLYTALKTPFVLDENLLRVNELPTHIAVREAVVNTLIHANYNESTAILITKWPDRFEFRNPGTMRVYPTKAGASDCRNRNLQRMFMFVGYSEQAGSGYPKILSGWHGEHWAEPFISDDYDDCQTFLTLKLNDIPATEHHIVPYDVPEGAKYVAESTEKSTDAVRNTTLKSTLKSTLNKTDRAIVDCISSNGAITITELESIVGLTRDGINKAMRRLKAANIIRRVGPDRGGHWEVMS